MKKLAVILVLLMIAGAAPGWCVLATVDNYVDTHTKDSSYRPVQDAGELYGAVNHGVGSAMDKVPVIKERHRVMEPMDKVTHESVSMTKKVLNGIWDAVTLKSLRDR